MGLKLNESHQLLAYANGVKLLGDNADTINKNRETLIDDNKEVCLNIDVEKSRKVCTCCCLITERRCEL
jgi:hypothetical protein